MKVVVRSRIGWLRRLSSFSVSALVHGCILAWVIFGGTGQPRERAKSLYDQEIRPNEKKIVWYNLREKLPEISPSDRPEAERRPPRARVKAEQTLVAGARDDARPAPLIWAAEPEIQAPKPVPLPNVVAVAPPKVVRPFVAPPVKPLAPPPVVPLAEGPRVAAAVVKTELPLPAAVPNGPRRAFTPPPVVRLQRQAMLPLPEGPQPATVVEPDALPLPVAVPKGPVRAFVTPAGKSQPAPRPVPALSAEPAAERVSPPAEASLAIVGLNPARTTEVPKPPGSRPAAFSAGPEVRAEGGTGAHPIALVNVPGLVVKGGAKDSQPTLLAPFSPTSKENLLAAARGAAAGPKVPAPARAPRVADAPDPRFNGRAVYAIAIQMPNVTSFSGSWLVWFAEREADEPRAPGAVAPPLRLPEVVRKVDPKYVAAAVAERVEGTVRLFAVIGKDGHVRGMSLLRQLDDRLDRSAQEALAKWEFTPALRDGVAVDVEAIFEIPFHLAPRPKL